MTHLGLESSVANPERFDADPDPNTIFYYYAYLDPNLNVNIQILMDRFFFLQPNGTLFC